MEYPAPADVIGKTYDLTPAELRVLFGIVQIGGVPKSPPRSASPMPRSRRTSADCLKKPAPAAKPIWCGSSPASPCRWRVDPAFSRHVFLIKNERGIKRALRTCAKRTVVARLGFNVETSNGALVWLTSS
jgi:hypothetical protein